MSFEDKKEQIIIIDEDEKTNIDELIQDKEIVIDIKEEKQNKCRKSMKISYLIYKCNEALYRTISYFIYGCNKTSNNCNGFALAICFIIIMFWVIIIMISLY